MKTRFFHCLSAFNILCGVAYLFSSALSGFETAEAKIESEKPWQTHPDYLVFGVPNKTTPFGLLGSAPAQMRLSLQLVYEPLIRINAEQELEPALAKAWHVDSDGKTIILDLQPGHFFSDGTPVDSNAVISSIRKFCSPKSVSSSDVSGLAGCSSGAPKAEAISPLKLRLSIEVSPSLFLSQLTSPRAGIAYWKTGIERPLGSGPYVVEQLSDDYLVLGRNPNYFRKDWPRNPGIIIRYAEEESIDSILQTDPLDGTLMYRVSAYRRKPPEAFEIKEDQATVTQLLVLNQNKYPFNSKTLRKALIAEFYDRGDLSTCASTSKPAFGLIPIGLGGSIAHIAPKSLPEITPETVFETFPELKKGTLSITIHRHIGRKNSCEEGIIKQVFRKYHLKATFKHHADYKTLWPLYLNHNLSAFIELYTFPNREAYAVVRRFHSDSGENFSNAHDQRLDDLLSKIGEAPTTSARFQTYRAVNEYIQEQGIVIPMHYISHSNYVSKCIDGASGDFSFNPFYRLPSLSRRPKCDGETRANQ